jgi:predicted enzyme related to lactoylglutathione lyase
VDIGTDVPAAKAFYTALFGWTAVDAGPEEETGGYGFFQKNGKAVTGFGPQQSPGPPFWATYISTADADATAALVKDAGGQAFMEPMDVMDAGRMGVFSDPTGAVFSIWQPGRTKGAELVNEPGAFSWNELNTRDLDTAKVFYSAVFGWECETVQMGPVTYTEVKLEGRSIAGMTDMANVPSQVPPHWLVYFAVDDCDATVARAKELGGSVQVPPMDIPPGRFSVVADDKGAHFAVIKLAA